MRSKISHLPRNIREQLNTRLDDGEANDQILPWLNTLAAVKRLLATKFDSSPISRQNLADWQQTGFRDWLNQQQALELARQIAGDATEFNDAIRGNGEQEGAEGAAFTDKMAQWFAIRYLVVAKALLTAVEDRPPEEQEVPMRRICRDLATLRRGDHSAARLQLERERENSERRRVDLEHLRFEFEREKEQRDQVGEFLKWSKQPEIKDQLFPLKPVTREQIDKIRVRLFGKIAIQPQEPDPEPEEDTSGFDESFEPSQIKPGGKAPGAQAHASSGKVQQCKNDPGFDSETPGSQPGEAS